MGDRGQPLDDGGRRAHGVGGHEAAATGQSPHRQRLVAVYQHPLWRIRDRGQLVWEIAAVALLSQVIGGLRHLDVGVHNLLALGSEVVPDDALHELQRELGDPRGGAQGGGVGHNLAAVLLRDAHQGEGIDAYAALLQRLGIDLELLGEDDCPSLHQLVHVELHSLRRQSKHQVHGVAVGEAGLCGEAYLIEVVPAPDARSVVLHPEDVQTCPRER